MARVQNRLSTQPAAEQALLSNLSLADVLGFWV